MKLLPETNLGRRRAIIRSALYVAAPIILVGLFALRREHIQMTFNRPYGQLAVGLTAAQVRTLFGRQPDYVCLYQENLIVYFTRGTFTDADPDEMSLPFSAATKEDIPWLYVAAQLMFDDTGSLIAFTWNGEALTIETRLGEFSGSSFRKLDNEILSQLIGS